MIRSIGLIAVLSVSAPLFASLQPGPSRTSELQFLTQSGYRHGQMKVERLLRSEADHPAILISVFDPGSGQYWWAIFRNMPPGYTIERFERDLLPRMKFVSEPAQQIAGFFTSMSQLWIRTSTLRAVSLDAGHSHIRDAVAEAALTDETAARTEWKTVSVPNSFVVCHDDPWKALPPQVHTLVSDAQHENLRWYITLKNFCGKRRVITLSESFEPLD